MDRKKIIPLKVDSSWVKPLMVDNSRIVPMVVDTSTWDPEYRRESMVPKCPHCGKVPMKCPTPSNCKFEDL